METVEVEEVDIEQRSPLISIWLPSRKMMKAEMKKSGERAEIASLDRKKYRNINIKSKSGRNRRKSEIE